MGIKMDLGAADSQATSIKEVMTARIAAYDQAIAALEQFIAAPDLQGQAYSNAKGYAEGKLLPFYRGLKALAQAMLDNHDKFPTTYRSTVGEESLDEDKLTQQISDLKQSIQDLEATQESLNEAKAVAGAAALGVLASLVLDISSQIGDLSTQRKEVQDKLDKLRAFAARSSGLINSIGPLISAVLQGQTEVDQDFANFGGSFPTLQKGQSPDWVKTINKYLEEQKKAAKLKKVERQMDSKQASSIDIKGLSKAFLKKVNKMSLAELEKHYGGAIRAREQFRGTGYGRVVLNANGHAPKWASRDRGRDMDC